MLQFHPVPTLFTSVCACHKIWLEPSRALPQYGHRWRWDHQISHPNIHSSHFAYHGSWITGAWRFTVCMNNGSSMEEA